MVGSEYRKDFIRACCIANSARSAADSDTIMPSCIGSPGMSCAINRCVTVIKIRLLVNIKRLTGACNDFLLDLEITYKNQYVIR